MTAIQKVREFVLHSYGNLITVKTPEFHPEQRTWIAELKADYPRIIKDDSTEETFLRFLSMENVGKICMTEDLRVKSATSRVECIGRIRSFLDVWQRRAERIITYASSDRLANLSEARWMFSPIMRVISNFIQTGFVSQETISTAPRQWRLRQYLKLLEGLDLAAEKDDGYTYGNLFTELDRQSQGDYEKLRTAVLSCVIRERYSTLRDVFKTHQFEPYVHINTCYYKPALEAETLIFRKPETVISTYLRSYRKDSLLKLRHRVQLLIEVGALHRKKGFLYGDRELFSRMLELKAEMPQLASPVAGVAVQDS